MEEKAIRGVSWSFLGLGLNKVVGLSTSLILARLLLPSDFGLMAIGLVAINFLFWFGGISFGAALVIHQELDRRGQGTVFTLSVGAASAAAAIAVGLAPVAARTLHQPRLTGVLDWLALAVLLGGIISFYDALLLRELEFQRRFWATTTASMLGSVLSIVLAVAGAGIWSLVAGQLFAAAISATALVAVAPARIAPRWDPAVARKVARSSRGYITQGVTVFIRQNIDTVMVGRWFSAASIGFYSMAFRLGDLTYSTLADPVARVTFPAFARGRARNEDVRPSFLGVIRLVALFAFPAGLLLSAASRPFTETIFGANWGPMVGPLTVVGIWAAVRPVEATIAWLLNALGRAGTVGWVALIVLGPLAAGLAVAVRSGKLELVALVPLADTILSLGILTVLARRHAQVQPRDIWRAVRPVFLSGAGLWAITRVVAGALGGLPPLVALAGCVLAGLGAYVASLWVIERDLLPVSFRQITRVLRRRQAEPAAP